MADLLRKAGLVLLAFAGLVFFAWAMFYPAVPHSLKGWAALVFLGLPFLIICGLVGVWLNKVDPIASWPDKARLLFYGICAALLLIFGAVPFTHLLDLIKS